MNALIVIGLCALGANAQFISGAQPYYNNLLHSGAFSAGVYGINPLPYTTAAVAPVPAPSPTLTKFHAQDELGQYNFGHYGGPSSRNEVRDAFGVVRGQVNYIDADGIVQQQNYVADAMGFRVSATNLPVAPEAPEAIYLNPPKPVEDTPEVAAAKVVHMKALEDARAAAAPAPEVKVAPAPEVEAAPAVAASPVEEAAPVEVEALRKKRDVGSVAIHSAVAPFAVAPHAVAPPAFVAPIAPAVTYAAATGHAFAPIAQAAVTYAATSPAFAPAGATYYGASPYLAPRDATLLRIENNPGHAVSYRVY